MGYQPKYDTHGAKVKQPPWTRREKVEITFAVVFLVLLVFAFLYGLADMLIYMSEHR